MDPVTAAADHSSAAVTAPPRATTPPPSSPTGACSAAMDNATPARYSTVHVLVTSHLANASVTTVAHYKTTDTTKTGTTDGTGKADIPYSISGASSGFTVTVDVDVDGREHCATSFTAIGRGESSSTLPPLQIDEAPSRRTVGRWRPACDRSRRGRRG